MIGYRRPEDVEALAHNFRVFAAADCVDEPLYAALSFAIAEDTATLALLMQAPYEQRRPVLLFAATHDLLLAGSGHPLARFYRSIAAAETLRTDVERAAPCFFDFCKSRRADLVAMLTTKTTQTNEVGRCAGLRLALSTLADDRPIALIDVGCSAGLNLLVDRYRFAYRMADASNVEEGPASDVLVRALIVDGAPFDRGPRPMPPIASRIGIDRSPLDVHDAVDARWLRACVWPSDVERHARLAAAIATARATPSTLLRGDAINRLDDALEAIEPGLRPVVFHSWVVSYFDHPARQRFADRVRAMVRERDGVWISAEGPDVVPGLTPAPLADDADAALREATSWHVTTRDDAGHAVGRLVARSQAHCRWIGWLDRSAVAR